LRFAELATRFFPKSPHLFIKVGHSLSHKLNLAVDSFSHDAEVTLGLFKSLIQIVDQLLIHGRLSRLESGKLGT
jgi:hypothetical protein